MNILQDILQARPTNRSIDLDTISNWSYLHIFLSSTTLTCEDLLFLLKLEIGNRNRKYLKQRIYGRYLSTKRKQDIKLLNIA